jgi:hypothetical protein
MFEMLCMPDAYSILQENLLRVQYEMIIHVHVIIFAKAMNTTDVVAMHSWPCFGHAHSNQE